LAIHAKVRSTTHLRDSTSKVDWPGRLRTISTVKRSTAMAQATSLPA
jgi:hypothetical protein